MFQVIETLSFNLEGTVGGREVGCSVNFWVGCAIVTTETRILYQIMFSCILNILLQTTLYYI